MHRGDGNAGEHSSCTVEELKVYCIMSKVIRNEASKTGFMDKNDFFFLIFSGSSCTKWPLVTARAM